MTFNLFEPASDRYFIYLKLNPEPELLEIRNGNVLNRWKESNGLPASKVFAMTWFEGKLYLGHRQAFSCYDPAKKTFRVLASAMAPKETSKLDGARLDYEITGFLADPKRKRLLLLSTLDGIWQYDPATARLASLRPNLPGKTYPGDNPLDSGRLLWSHLPDTVIACTNSKTYSLNLVTGQIEQLADRYGSKGLFGREVGWPILRFRSHLVGCTRNGILVSSGPGKEDQRVAELTEKRKTWGPARCEGGEMYVFCTAEDGTNYAYDLWKIGYIEEGRKRDQQ
jgi:hypothetical protein